VETLQALFLATRIFLFVTKLTARVENSAGKTTFHKEKVAKRKKLTGLWKTLAKSAHVSHSPIGSTTSDVTQKQKDDVETMIRVTPDHWHSPQLSITGTWPFSGKHQPTGPD